MLIKVLPYFQKKIWGSNRLQRFNFKINQDQKIGEAWIVSGYQSKSSYVPNYDLTLDQLWIKNLNHIFGKSLKYQEFPLLIKILDANQDLSVQVHPDDQIINKQLVFGKPEAWYILEAPQSKKLIYGHYAHNKSEFLHYSNKKEWKKLLKYVKVKKNDFLYIPAGKVHALTTKSIVLEIQKSCDITYRIYDYDRLGLNQKKRELHLDQALKAISFPDSNLKITNDDSALLLKTNFFTIYLFETITKNKKEINFVIKQNWAIIVVIKGQGLINNQFVSIGESFILSYQEQQTLTIKKNLKVMVCYLTN